MRQQQRAMRQLRNDQWQALLDGDEVDFGDDTSGAAYDAHVMSSRRDSTARVGMQSCATPSTSYSIADVPSLAQQLMQGAERMLADKRPELAAALTVEQRQRLRFALRLALVVDLSRADGRRMYAHQHEGALFMAMVHLLDGARRALVRGLLLCDYMGLGKTLTFSHFLRLVFATGQRQSAQHNGKVLVFVPHNVFAAWHAELRSWLEPDRLTVLPLDDVAFLRNQVQRYGTSIVSMAADVVLAPITALSTSTTAWATAGAPWWLVAVDEAHALKDYTSATCKSFNSIKAHSRVLLTGTPYLNNTREVRTLLRTIGVAVADGKADQEHLRQELHRNMLRRVPMGDLLRGVHAPPVDYKRIDVGLSAVQRRILRHPYVAKKLSKMDKLQARHRQLQFCYSPDVLYNIVKETDLDISRDELLDVDASLALRAFVDDVRSHEHKSIVFVHYHVHVHTIVNLAARMGRQVYTLVGGGTADEKTRTIEAFLDNSRPCMIVTTIACGGTGLNLQAAKYVYFLLPDYTHAMELQGVARCARSGQVDRVTAVFINVDISCVDECQKIQFAKIDEEAALLGSTDACDRHRLRFRADNMVSRAVRKRRSSSDSSSASKRQRQRQRSRGSSGSSSSSDDDSSSSDGGDDSSSSDDDSSSSGDDDDDDDSSSGSDDSSSDAVADGAPGQQRRRQQGARRR
jgi:hypothetical protein